MTVYTMGPGKLTIYVGDRIVQEGSCPAFTFEVLDESSNLKPHIVSPEPAAFERKGSVTCEYVELGSSEDFRLNYCPALKP